MRIATKTALAFAAFAIVCVVGSGGLLIREFREGLDEAVLERQRLLASNRALVLRENLALASGELERLAAMPGIDPSDGDDQPERRVLTQAYQQTSFFNARLELHDAEGRCRWGEPEQTRCADEARVSDRSALDEARGEPQHTLVSASGIESPEQVALVTAVVRGGVVVGALRGVVDLHGDLLFSPALHDELADATHIALLDSGGRDLIPSEPRILSPAARRAAAEGLATGRSGASVLPGGERVLAWAPVGRAGLGLAFSWPRAALDDSTERHVRSLSLSIGVVALLALLTGFVVARVLTRPLQRLATQVRGLRDRPLRSLPHAPAQDEVGDVSRALQGLLAELDAREREVRDDRDRIAELASQLESRIEARTVELREAQGALVEAERMAAIGRAGTVISHELRNSLNAVSVAMDALGGDGDAESKQVTRRLVRGEIARLRKLSDELIRYAREPVLEREHVGLAEVMETAALLLDAHAREAKVEVELRPDDAPEVFVDPDLLQSVVVNVLRNAIDAAAGSDDSRARISARATEGGAEILIEDSGAGVDPSIREQLFQAFVTTRRRGLGLGLAVADRFIQAHGGHIRLDRSALGGARFFVQIPSFEGEAK